MEEKTVNASVFGNVPSPPDRIVDWVLVELRDADNPALIVASRSALIQRDGDVVDLDGSSAVVMTAEPGNYHVALRHRNHLGVMTAGELPLNTTPTTHRLQCSWNNRAWHRGKKGGR
ncbi:MAG: hypothetical protein IPG69_18780 [Flavobacteriales bacterium]|nr:hypothetical protein [Flavobacteriales bacterium]